MKRNLTFHFHKVQFDGLLIWASPIPLTPKKQKKLLNLTFHFLLTGSYHKESVTYDILVRRGGFRKVTERASTRRRNLIRPCSGVRRPRWQTTKSSNCTIQWPNKKRYSSPKSLARFPCTFAVSPPMISVTSVTLAPLLPLTFYWGPSISTCLSI